MTQENNPQPADIKELLNRTDRFAVLAGCRITEADERHAIAVMTVTEAHLNGGNVCQGGALFTLADLAIAALMNHGGHAVEVRVTNQDGRLICHVTGMGYRKNAPLTL